jgi:dihydroxyacetone kinase-like protein
MTDGLNTEGIKSILTIIKNIMDENRDSLIELDNIMGDGDLGITMTKAFTAANDEARKSSETDPSKLLVLIGMAMAKAAPSTMGTLVATGFMKGGKAIQGIQIINLHALAIFFQAFTQGIMDRGKSKPGDKTIVDVLHPVALSLIDSSEKGKLISEALSDAYGVAEQAVKDTIQLKAQHGRAAYYQEASIGKQDAGSTVGMFIIKGFHQFTSNIS